jgi:6-phosphofructokinase 1
MAGARGLPVDQLPSLEPGGPRKRIYFDPAKTRVGIVTCGGLCPGLNDVIRGLVLELSRHYGVRRIVGFRNGYRGFVPRYGEDVVDLTAEVVMHIDDEGGTILGTSRGEQDPEEVVDALERLNINILFVIGGDGTIRGPWTSSAWWGAGPEGRRRRDPEDDRQRHPLHRPELRLPDRDGGGDRSHPRGERRGPLRARGIGLVKLMGRHSGFIACYATLAKDDADYVLIPEVPFAWTATRGCWSTCATGCRSGGTRGGRPRGPGRSTSRRRRRAATPRATSASATSVGCCAG